MTNPTLTTETLNPVKVARDMRDTMDSVYDGEVEESTATAALESMFDYCLPHYQAMFEIDPWAAEQVANAAEWLERLNDLPEV